MQRLRQSADSAEIPGADDIVQILTYVLGHVLHNAILKFPGPILSGEALCSYVSTSEAEITPLRKIFAQAVYGGPFGGEAQYFWREDVDNILETIGAAVADQEFESFGDFNRAAVEANLLRPLAVHTCARDGCGGRKGGFLCPFTHRPVCERADCSVSASSWIPQGAQLSRVERDFYDEWAPLLGF